MSTTIILWQTITRGRSRQSTYTWLDAGSRRTVKNHEYYFYANHIISRHIRRTFNKTNRILSRTRRNGSRVAERWPTSHLTLPPPLLGTAMLFSSVTWATSRLASFSSAVETWSRPRIGTPDWPLSSLTWYISPVTYGRQETTRLVD